MRLRILISVTVCAALVALVGGSATVSSSAASPKAARAYPTKGITIIVPFAAGGPADVMGRVYANFASSYFHVPVTVQNVVGASGITGTLQAINAAPDGYTLFVDSQATSALLQAAVKNLPFNITNRTYISELSRQYTYFVVPASSPWKTLKQAMAAAKANPSSFAWGAGAAGSSIMFACLELFKAAGVPVAQTRTTIISGGDSAEAAAVASGSVQFGAISPAAAASLSAAGKVRVLASPSPNSHAPFPNVPTAKKAGYPGVSLYNFQALAGPANLPASVISTWTKALQKAVYDKTVRQQAAANATALILNPGSTVAKFVADEYKQVLPLAEAAGIRQ